MNNRHKAIISGLLTVVIIIVLLGIAEGAVRFRQWIQYGGSQTIDQLYAFDEASGLRLPKAGNKTGSVEINTLGFRGPEISTPKPDGTIRLAFLGASTTFCAEASSNQAVWPHLVANSLDSAFPAVEVDYVNGGVPGYTITNSLKNLNQRVAPLQPDIIFIYHATNDLSLQTRELAQQQGLFSEQEDSGPSWMAEFSLLWNLVEKNLKIMRAQHSSSNQTEQLQLADSNLGEAFYRKLSALVEAAKQQAPVVAIATFSTRLRPQQDEEQRRAAAVSALYYMPYMTPDSLIESFERYNTIIRRVAAEQDIILVEAAKAIPGDAEHFNDSVHFTDAGSAIMAAQVSAALRDSEAVQTLMSPSVQ